MQLDIKTTAGPDRLPCHNPGPHLLHRLGRGGCLACCWRCGCQGHVCIRCKWRGCQWTYRQRHTRVVWQWCCRLWAAELPRLCWLACCCTCGMRR